MRFCGISSGGLVTANLRKTSCARELETHTAPEPDLEAEICACVSRLAGTLKPECAEALWAIDVSATAVKAFAEHQEARDGVLRHLRRAWLPQLHLPDAPLIVSRRAPSVAPRRDRSTAVAPPMDQCR